MFQLFGSTWELPEAMLSQLESFMCALYRRKYREVNVLRYEMFKDTYEKKNKIQDLAFLPPCKQTLTLHSRRANYIARVWKLCFRPVIDYDDITSHGWKENGQTVWTSGEFPNDIEAILVGDESSNEDSDDSDGSELESDYSGTESSNEDDNE